MVGDRYEVQRASDWYKKNLEVKFSLQEELKNPLYTPGQLVEIHKRIAIVTAELKRVDYKLNKIAGIYE